MEVKKEKKAPKVPEIKTIPLHVLNLKVTGGNQEVLIDENGNTVVCLLMQEDGKIMTSFMGDYNKAILTTFDQVLKSYFKDIKKQLLGKKSSESKTKKSVKETGEKKETNSRKNPTK